MTIETPELGLRERKRLATRRAIQLAAVEIAAQQGVDRVTVDEISRIADISPRTFFNYFPTKEAALVGDGPQVPDEDAVEAFVSAGSQSIFSGIARLLSNAIDLAGEDHELTSARRVLLKQHPQLFALRMLTMRQFEDELQVVIDRRLAADGVPAGPERVSRSRLVTLVAFAAMRHAWACWADEGGGTNLSVRLDESFAQLEDLFA
jgi:AcrR family transcriptional regulator